MMTTGTSQTDQVWRAVLGSLEMEVPRPTFETWLRGTRAVSLSGKVLTVGVPNAFAAEWLERRMASLIQRAVSEVCGSPVGVRFEVTAAPAGDPAPARWRGEASGTSGCVALPPRTGGYTFESFVVGVSNQLAFAAACSVADAPGSVYNPLFIYSGVGLGKTHLLNAIASKLRDDGRSCQYVTAEQFTNQFIAAIRERSTEEFRTRYRSVDALLLDDIQFVAGKEQTQEGLFHTFNDLHTSGRQIILTSDRPPRAMPLLEDRLRSRFEWGLTVDIQPPEYETRLAILRAKAEQMGMDVSDEVVAFVAQKVQRNVRELEGCLNRLQAFQQFSRSTMDTDLARRALADLIDAPARRTTSPERLLAEVARVFRVPVSQIVARRRDKPTALARQVAMYLMREELQLSLSDIGRLLGGRDHSTVDHGCEQIAKAVETDGALRKQVLEAKARLYEEAA